MKGEFKKSLTLVIPAHNAEKVIENSIIEYCNIFSYFDKFEIIVVCNACSDKTLDVVQKLKKNYPIEIINIPHRGKGNALRRGFDKAKYELIGFLDSDNPFNLE